MKFCTFLKFALSLSIASALVGCTFSPANSGTVAVPARLTNGQVLDIAADAGKAVGFPPVTKIDKANGIVEFGNYEMSELGTTAQVRVRDDHKAEITVKRTSVYIPFNDGDEIEKKFQAAFNARLKGR